MLFDDRSRAIVSAQWRTLLNYYPRGSKGATIFTAVTMTVWYGFVVFLAWLTAAVIPEVRSLGTVARFLSFGAAGAMLYWQLVPLALVSGGMSLQVKRLAVYPIPEHKLFALEVILRVTTGIEPLILMAGAMIGLWRHPAVPFWAPLAFVPFALLNMVLSAGLRDLMMRILARRGLREIVVLGFVLLTALPQVLVSTTSPEKLRGLEDKLGKLPSLPLPWTVTVDLATVRGGVADLFWLGLWLLAGTQFGLSQFRRNLRWDADEAQSKERASVSARGAGFVERLYRLPSTVLPDPLGVLVEKEFRSLTRAPRFRLVFFMGFSFGLAIWLPILFGKGRSPGFFSDNFLVLVSLYAALLLGEVLFWNFFGFDRQAVQAYFVVPVRFTQVIVAKNIAAVVLMLLEVSIVAIAVRLIGFPVSFDKLVESFAVTMLFCVLLLSAGNIASLSHPRAVNPAQSWRNTSSGRVQGLLLVLYPLMTIPAGLAYLARYAFETQSAFYMVLGAGFLVACMAYGVSLDSAKTIAAERTESIIEALSSGQGPIA